MECQNLCFDKNKNKRNILICRLLKILPRVLNVKQFSVQEITSIHKF